MATSANRDPPTTLAYCIATAILAGLSGYFVGQASNLGLFSTQTRQRSSSSVTNVNASTASTDTTAIPAKVEEAEDSESDDEEDLEDFGVEDGQDLQGFEDARNEECKLVLVVRTDLGMTKGELLPRLSPTCKWTNVQ